MPMSSSPDGPTPDLSVIVCTRNRAAAIVPCLDSVAASAAAVPGAAIELVVVDNGSTDGTAAAVAAWAAASALPVRLVTEGRAGVSRARNAAVRAARGRLLAFTDDDCRLHRDHARDLLARAAADRGPVLRGGRVEVGGDGALEFTTKTDDDVQHYHPGIHPGGFLHGCNMTLPREAALRLGGFDERFGPGAEFRAAEDTDYVWRAWRAGMTVEYVPDMTVFHHHGRSTVEDIATLSRLYQEGNGALYAKHARAGWPLLRHLYWNARNAARELVGGPWFDAALRLSHRALVRANLRGALRYARLAAYRRLAEPRASERDPRR